MKLVLKYFIIFIMFLHADCLICKQCFEDPDDLEASSSCSGSQGTCEVSGASSFCFSRMDYYFEGHVFREYLTRGCSEPEEKHKINCGEKSVSDVLHPYSTQCCNHTDLCNVNLLPLMPEIYKREFLNPPSIFRDPNAVVIGVVCGLGVVVLVTSYILFRFRKSTVECWKNQISDCFDLEKGQGDEGSNSSGSGGSRGPRIVQRTLGKDLEFMFVIGSGTYGEVVTARRKGLIVAVKIFSSVHESSWANEREIYRSSFLSHENVIRYISDDVTEIKQSTRFLLVTDYHSNGSLYDFLQTNVIDEELCLQMILSISLGLEHMHDEYKATDTVKYGIAHRDLKSRNILVKDNLDCCIADFGLAIISNSFVDGFRARAQVGTKRYLAPEILNESINTSKFNDFKKSDIYSISLVFWEICTRYLDGAYSLPYSHCVASDPSIDTMKSVVCDMKLRPIVDSDEWQKDPILKKLHRMISECWETDPEVRCSALRIRKATQNIIQG